MSNGSVKQWLDTLRYVHEPYDCCTTRLCRKSAELPFEVLTAISHAHVATLRCEFERVGRLKALPRIFGRSRAARPADVGAWQRRLRCEDEAAHENEVKALSEEDILKECDVETAAPQGKVPPFPAVDEPQLRARPAGAHPRPNTVGNAPKAKPDAPSRSFVKKQINKWLKKRSSRDVLETRGILRNEPVFGNTLRELYERSGGVPCLLRTLIALIERPPNLRSMGVYRTSPNQATLQRIRLKVDEGRLGVLDEYAGEVDVLAGTMKLFFRELRHALVTFATFERLIAVIGGGQPAMVRLLLERELDAAEYATFAYVLAHLRRVCEFERWNRMSYRNIAIAWGPSFFTLDDASMVAYHSTNSHRITEYLLEQYEEVFVRPCREDDRVWRVVAALVGLIDRQIGAGGGLYCAGGVVGVRNEILGLCERFEFSEVGERFGGRPVELCDALLAFIRGMQEPLISNRTIDLFLGVKEEEPAKNLRVTFEVGSRGGRNDEFREKGATIDGGVKREKVGGEGVRERFMEEIEDEKYSKSVKLLIEHWRKVLEVHRRDGLKIVEKLTDVLAPEKCRQFKSQLDQFNKLMLCVLPCYTDIGKTRIQSTYDNVYVRKDC